MLLIKKNRARCDCLLYFRMRENTTQRAWNMNILGINVGVTCVPCYIEPDMRWQLGPFQPKDVQSPVLVPWHWERHPTGSACPAPGVPGGLVTYKVELSSPCWQQSNCSGMKSADATG